MNRIEILLKQYGPMLSGDLAKKYKKKYRTKKATCPAKKK